VGDFQIGARKVGQMFRPQTSRQQPQRIGVRRNQRKRDQRIRLPVRPSVQRIGSEIRQERTQLLPVAGLAEEGRDAE